MTVKGLTTQAVFHYLDVQAPMVRYLVALLMVGSALLAMFYIPLIGERSMFLIVIFAIIQSAFWLGRIFGILIIMVSILCGVNALILDTAWISSPLFAVLLNAGFSMVAIATLIAVVKLTEVSEASQASEQLLNQLSLEDQLVKVAASVPGLICSFRLCPDGSASMPYASSVIESVYGFTPDEVREDFSAVFAHIHPDDIDHIHETIHYSAQTPPYKEFQDLER